MHYTNGGGCWNGPARSMKATSACSPLPPHDLPAGLDDLRRGGVSCLCTGARKLCSVKCSRLTDCLAGAQQMCL
eukprot:766053-Hanusia_phi.AAC.1